MKFDRGREHVAALVSERATFLAGEPYAIETVERDDKRVFFLRVQQDPPEGLATIAGDAIHNLRSSLDLAICELIAHTGGQVTEDTAFPIVKEKSGLHAGLKRLKGASPGVPQAVRELEPYRDGNRALWRLHRLDIVDKHRLLVVVGMAYQAVSFDGGDMMARRFPDAFKGAEPPSMPIAIRPADRLFPLADGAELFSEPLADLSLNPGFHFELSLGAEGLAEGGEPVSEIFDEITGAVSTALGRLEEC
jgi:hypothetical protein